MGTKLIDLTGMVFERLTVINRDYTRKGQWYWWCKCSCNNELVKKSISTNRLKKGITKSCGCIRKEVTGALNKIRKRKYNIYDTTGYCGIGYTLKGEEFYFDLEDYDLIKNSCWRLYDGYVYTSHLNGNGIQTQMHRLVMNANDNEDVDHIFHNENDNRKSQLRLVSDSKNQMNRVLQINNTSGVKGVHWHKRDMCWVAQIRADSKSIHLGNFNNFDDAVKARKKQKKSIKRNIVMIIA